MYFFICIYNCQVSTKYRNNDYHKHKRHAKIHQAIKDIKEIF